MNYVETEPNPLSIFQNKRLVHLKNEHLDKILGQEAKKLTER